MQKFIRNLALAAVVVVGAISCSESGIDENITPSEGLTLEATTPSGNPSTKVEFADQGDKGIALEWEADDEFKLYQGETLIDTFVATNGDGKFTSKNPNLTLTEGETYTAKFNGEATTAEQNGDEINNLHNACQMEAEFTYGDDNAIAFEHTKAIMTFQFESDERPAYLIFKNGDDSYKVTYSALNPDDNGIYTSHIMIEPCDATERIISFTLYDSEGEAYDERFVQSAIAYTAGMRYTSPISVLPQNNNWQDYAAETFADGTPYSDSVNDYTINTAEQLALLAKLVNGGKTMYRKTFTLANDIDLSGKEWSAIGCNSHPAYFAGTFDGAGFAINGLYIDNPDSQYQALFGYVVVATIKNLSVSGSVVGGSKSGGIVGYLENRSDGDCLVINCHNAVSVKGDYSVGGIAGYAANVEVVNCYNTAAVVGNDGAGGIVGVASSSTVANCYNTATVVGNDGAGAIVGRTNNSTTINCYWNTSIADMPEVGIGSNSGSSINVVGMTATEMQDPDFATTLSCNAFIYYGKNTCAWKAVEGCLPILDYDSESAYTYSFEGEGTESSPYRISTAEDLRALSSMTINNDDTYEGKYFVMTQDIDLGGIDDDDKGIAGKSFVPIGDYPHKFKGTFDGAGYAVKGLYVTLKYYNKGLFSTIEDATIKNLSVAGRVCGCNYVGGVVGYSENSTISNCYNAASVEGDHCVGGVVGYISSSSSVTNCYNTASVKGRYNVGGVVGYISSSSPSSSVTNCYNTASVNGTSKVGGVVGYISSSSVTNCYWNTSATDAPKVGIGLETNHATSSNIVGMTTTKMQEPTFATILNNNAYYYNNPDKGDKPKVEACAWSEVADSTPALDFDGKPSAKDMEYNESTGVYEICTAKGLAECVKKISNGENTINIKLMCDIDLNGSASNQWTPIENYQGIFDGNGCTISGLYINSSANYIGLFAYVSGGTIKDLTVDGEVTGSGYYVAGIAGYATLGARFEYCTNNAKISGAQEQHPIYVGGIVGQGAEFYGTVFVGCVNTGTISAKGNTDTSAGGIIGKIPCKPESKIISCANKGDISANCKYAGGLVGYNTNVSILNSYNRGAVSSEYSEGRVGGISGNNGYNAYSAMNNCYSSGDVSGNGNVGAIAGYITGSEISHCYYDSSKGAPFGDGSYFSTVVPYTYLSTLLTDLNSYATEQGLDGWVEGDDGYPMLEFEQ